MVYTNKQKIANVNEALDKYWFLASQSAAQGTFDDTNRTNVPVETQNLVSGTNNYKVSAFTNEVLDILRLAALDSDGVEYDLVYQPFENIENFLQEYDTSVVGKPIYWTKNGDYIYIAPCPNYNYTAGLRAYVNRELSKYAYTSFTITIAAPGVITATAHGLSNGDAVLLITDGALPTGLTADSTIYYVSGKTDDTFKLSTTPALVGSTEITTSGSQSGTHYFVKVSTEPGIPVIHHDYIARYAAYKFLEQDHPKFSKIREELAMDRNEIQKFWHSRIKEDRTIMQTAKRAYK